MLSAITRVASMVAVTNTIGHTKVQAEQQIDTPYGNWVLESFSDGDEPSQRSLTLELHNDGSVTGSSGRNRYRGSFTFTKDTIGFFHIVGTKIIGTPAIMEQEKRLFKALEEAVKWEMEADILLLRDSYGAITAKFSPQTPDSSATIDMPDALYVDRRRLKYNCGNTSVDIEYFNAENTSTTTLSLSGEFTIAADVVSSSGARYAGKRLIWWTKDDNAHLFGVNEDEETPASHLAIKNNKQ